MFQNKITIALTSCGRFSLLERTILSIEQSIDLSQYKKILTEDSKDLNHISKMQEANKNGFLQWWTILYTGWSGHTDVLRCHYSALRALYDHIDTPYVFHCEDDQVFYKVDYDFMQLSYDILENNKNIAIVILRDLHRDYWIKKEWITRSRYYDILTDREENFFGHDFVYGNSNAICTLQPWLRNTEAIKKAMFGYEDTVNEALMSRRLSENWYSGIYIKQWVYYNPNWRWNSTRISNIWFFQYIKTAIRNAVRYRIGLLIKYVQFLFSHR